MVSSYPLLGGGVTAAIGMGLPLPDRLGEPVAAATENILLTAHSFGLGGVWLAIYPWKKRIKDLKDLLNLPNDVIPISLVAIGHPNISKGFDDRYKPAKIHYNRW